MKQGKESDDGIPHSEMGELGANDRSGDKNPRQPVLVRVKNGRVEKQCQQCTQSDTCIGINSVGNALSGDDSHNILAGYGRSPAIIQKAGGGKQKRFKMVYSVLGRIGKVPGQ